MKILFLQMKRYSEFARLCFRSERVFVMGGDPTKNCNFHRRKSGFALEQKFKSCVPRKLLCKQRLLTQPSLSFASYEMPTSVLCSKFIFCTTAIHVHRHPIALHFLVCRENCFANKIAHPTLPFLCIFWD